MRRLFLLQQTTILACYDCLFAKTTDKTISLSSRLEIHKGLTVFSVCNQYVNALIDLRCQTYIGNHGIFHRILFAFALYYVVSGKTPWTLLRVLRISKVPRRFHSKIALRVGLPDIFNTVRQAPVVQGIRHGGGGLKLGVSCIVTC
jgi:hypothetical protein